jgi:deazaflavin-dependent oxidoreductase (nitroreductase family)
MENEIQSSNAPGWRKPIDALASLKPVSAVLKYCMPVLDRSLMRLSHGRIALTFGLPTLLLTTTGRTSGEPRSAPLLYIRYGDDIGLIGTSFGSTKHPAWYLNLMANPNATVLLNGETLAMTAREANPEERREIWLRATRLYVGFDKYKARVGDREIPILLLSRTS